VSAFHLELYQPFVADNLLNQLGETESALSGGTQPTRKLSKLEKEEAEVSGKRRSRRTTTKFGDFYGLDEDSTEVVANDSDEAIEDDDSDEDPSWVCVHVKLFVMWGVFASDAVLHYHK
jgi:hypothetical protein